MRKDGNRLPIEVTGDKYPQQYKNLYDAMKNSACRFPDKTAVIGEKNTITYQELLNRTDVLSGWLQKEFHVCKGERIGMLFVNSIEFYIAFYAVMKIGAIGVLVNTKMNSEEIKFTLEDTQVRCVIMNRCWIFKIRDIVQELGIDRIMTEDPCEEQFPHIRMASMGEILKSKGTDEENNSLSVQEKDMTAVILHTSGTTGKPKGIMVSHTNMMGTAYGYQEVLGLSEKDISVLSVPVFHILGLSCVSNLFIYMGATLIVFERFEANKILKAIESYRVTHFHSVPAVYIKMLREAERTYDLQSLRIAVCGGAVISRENRDIFCKMAPNASFRIAYGLTETAGSGVLSYEHKAPGREVRNCIIWVKNESTGQLEAYGEGEAVCQGEIVASRVWGKPSECKELLYTGDVIRKTREGDIFILDRIKDIINRGGEKIFPSVIEQALEKYAGVKEAVVFPVFHEVYGEVPAAVLVQKEHEKISLKEIEKDLWKHIGKFELPQYMEVWREEWIPRTGNGKVKKKVLREEFEKNLFQVSSN